MSKLLSSAILFVTLLITTNAFATKARLKALGNSFHIVDSQGIYSNPLRVHQFSNLVTLESGLTTSTTTSNNAEGLVYYSFSEKSRMAISFGKNDDMVQTGRTFINSVAGTTYEVPQNMLHGFYGFAADDIYYAGGVFLSGKNDKQNSLKEGSSGLALGVKKGSNSLYITTALTNSVDAVGSKKFDGAGYTRLSLRTTQMDLLLGLDLISWLAKSSTASVVDESYANQTIALRAIKSHKNEGSEVFYGASLSQQVVDCKTKATAACATQFKKLSLPAIVGIEVNAADWLVARGSITQSVLLDQTKDDIGLPTSATSGISGATGAVADFAASPNSTTVAMGLGFKLNSIILDGTISTATTQAVNMTTFLSQVGLTYNF